MSKERELLQTALGILEDYEWGYGGDHHKSPEASILNDIRKLLAQPEQDKIQYLLDQVSRLTAENAMLKEKWSAPPKREQTEQEPVVKITSIHADGENLPVAITGVVLSDAVNIWDLPIKNNDLLFLAPPKREPLSDKEIQILYGRHAFAMELDEYMWGFIDAEKAHGIRGGG